MSINILMALSLVLLLAICIKEKGWIKTIFFPFFILMHFMTPPSVKRRREQEAASKELALKEMKERENEDIASKKFKSMISYYSCINS